jgi:hypothetical protein
LCARQLTFGRVTRVNSALTLGVGASFFWVRTVEELDVCFVVKDGAGQKLKPLGKDEARRIAV